MLRDFKSILKAAVCVLVIDACGGTLGGNPEKTDPASQGQPEPAVPPALTFFITDAPVEDARHVYVSVESLQVAQADNGWITIPMETDEEIDLLQLQNGSASVLASIETLPTGTYGQTRLVLAEEAPARLIDNEGVEHLLFIPSGSESGLKIQTSFTKVEGVPLALTIDFDLRKSIKSNGNGNGNKNKYMLKPTLRLTDNSKTGSVSGQGQNGSVVCVYANDTSKDADDSCDNAITSTTVKNDQFKFGFLEPGLYDFRVFRNKAVVGDVDDVVVKAGKNDEGDSPEDNKAEGKKIKLP